jgi:hypothetical protein
MAVKPWAMAKAAEHMPVQKPTSAGFTPGNDWIISGR